jgi:1-acyl-sn-glycerol-3-phosphate acyltransferase
MIKYLKAVFTAGIRIIIAYFVWMIRYSNHPEKYPIELRFKRVQKLAQAVLKAFNVVYDLHGYDEYYTSKKPNENRLIVCNHLSDTDAIVMMALSKTPITFVAKKESEKFPFVGRVIKSLSGEFLDRNDLKQELRAMMNVQQKLTTYKNVDFIIYPEGTRNRNPLTDAKEFHHGTFRPAVKAGIPFTVCSIYGSQRVLDIKCKNKYNPIELNYIKTFTSNDYSSLTTPQIAIMAHDMVIKSVNEQRKVDHAMMHDLNKRHQDD